MDCYHGSSQIGLKITLRLTNNSSHALLSNTSQIMNGIYIFVVKPLSRRQTDRRDRGNCRQKKKQRVGIGVKGKERQETEKRQETR